MPSGRGRSPRGVDQSITPCHHALHAAGSTRSARSTRMLGAPSRDQAMPWRFMPLATTRSMVCSITPEPRVQKLRGSARLKQAAEGPDGGRVQLQEGPGLTGGLGIEGPLCRRGGSWSEAVLGPVDADGAAKARVDDRPATHSSSMPATLLAGVGGRHLGLEGAAPLRAKDRPVDLAHDDLGGPLGLGRCLPRSNMAARARSSSARRTRPAFCTRRQSTRWSAGEPIRSGSSLAAVREGWEAASRHARSHTRAEQVCQAESPMALSRGKPECPSHLVLHLQNRTGPSRVSRYRRTRRCRAPAVGRSCSSQAPRAFTRALRPASIAARCTARSSFEKVSLPLGQGTSTVRLICGTHAPCDALPLFGSEPTCLPHPDPRNLCPTSVLPFARRYPPARSSLTSGWSLATIAL